MSVSAKDENGVSLNQIENPYPDFNLVEQSREPFDRDSSFQFTQIPDVDWVPGSGAHDVEWTKHKKIEIDPYGSNRKPIDNYKIIVSSTIPRPIALVSTVSKDGKRNLAPFSYFMAVCHDPPVYCIGFAYKGAVRDTMRNIFETGELTINLINESFIEAANFTSVDSPFGIDEWKLSGLTPVDSTKVKPPHVAESPFSIECKLINRVEFHSKVNREQLTGTTIFVEGVNFHARDDIVNDKKNKLDIKKFRPVGAIGGIGYTRLISGYEKKRPDFDDDVLKNENRKLVESEINELSL